MLSNPFADQLFWPSAQVIVGLLGGALILLLCVERRHLRELPRRTLFRRWRTWALIAPIYTFSVLSGPGATTVLALALSLQGLREYASLVELRRPYRLVLLTLGAIPAPAALLSLDLFFALPPALLLVATLQPLLLHQVQNGVRHLAFAALGWAYLAWLLAFVVATRQHVTGGAGLLLVLGLAVALSDIAAFAIGSLVGRHRLAPRLSPSKTWEGLGGNLLGAMAGVWIMGYAWPPTVTWPLAIGIGVLVAFGAAWGDLVESAIKREFGAKDAGTWLPGFGGLLDRIDSLIIVVPLVYYALRLVGAG